MYYQRTAIEKAGGAFPRTISTTVHDTEDWSLQHAKMQPKPAQRVS